MLFESLDAEKLGEDRLLELGIRADLPATHGKRVSRGRCIFTVPSHVSLADA